jgi:hypothetical protein
MASETKGDPRFFLIGTSDFSAVPSSLECVTLPGRFADSGYVVKQISLQTVLTDREGFMGRPAVADVINS